MPLAGQGTEITTRQYANDREARLTYRECPADRVRVEAKGALPKRIGKDGDRGRIRVVVLGCDRSANQDRGAIALEEVTGDHPGMCRSRNTASIDCHALRLVGDGEYVGESLCMYGEILIHEIRKGAAAESTRQTMAETPFESARQIRPLALRITRPTDLAQFVCIADRQRLVQNAVYQTEDRRIHSNTQCQ